MHKSIDYWNSYSKWNRTWNNRVIQVFYLPFWKTYLWNLFSIFKLMFILTVRTHCVEFSCKTCLYLSCYRNCKDLDSFKYIHRHGHTLLLMNNLCRMPNKQKGERHAAREYNETSQKGRNVDITLQNSFRVWV